MGATTDVFTRRAEALAEGIYLLEQGAAAFVFLGVTYGAAGIPSLDTLYEYYVARSAREAILAGAQEHTILGRTFKKADLAAVNNTIATLQGKVDIVLGTTATRTGPRMRQVVPLG